MEEIDREYFFLRWSEAWLAANQRRIAEKWRVDIATQNAPGRGVHWVRMHRRYGLAFLGRMRKRLGRKLARWVEKRFVIPFEPMINRLRYPESKYGQTMTPTVTVINDGNKVQRRAA